MSASIKAVTVLGATGSIGLSTLDVLSRHTDRFRLYAVTANTQVEKMAEICRNYRPEVAVMADTASAEQLKKLLQNEIEVTILGGAEALSEVASAEPVDVVMAAIVGSVGLMPTLSAARAGKRILLANKEALVMAGHLFMSEVEKHGAELLPIDSEHNAIFQCLESNYQRELTTQGLNNEGPESKGVAKILLTGSGGPFREYPLDKFDEITPEQAVAHPNWSMGPKISVDSATMMNKGLELIEACWLFNVSHDDVEIVLHKQSIIHSMVAYNDGSVLAQMGNPDMRTPIANALGWPERISSGVEPLDLIQVSQLNFEKADENRFPCLRLARQAIQRGGTSMAILNAANEVAVQAFLQSQIAFTHIAELIEQTMNNIPHQQTDSLQQILADDQAAREFVNHQLSLMSADC
ncbi:MAG: 1-deoxy-D-xylulose-5-phosphate reductoisomerase [Gammaproteobacteria bacterium]|jgi:1-deoxy-D-xylulose-5-phosphate reductoisomerase|nr:1-deoxy-D-xylulose-5-phosphate reductoisomerase [Gammaproteobacteria bacterium]MBT4078914.1 1-deoxy-D-xylulose-5-phosphate reductoisomerase [Gammaproteobacteria bacterium]MBT4196382.1 1-deoxy-D-xylulose-5-phosphate reductoisomerase [Gammaproteobacteria bacterium]MBT4448197.1 1-deoxy-D-xylulose-5-phosphate reductoisomerase [Gammaproteobacteria bacterium]MBT4862742.1 1-deoxy-D-xylulose-5-phosphate reductoisomerase [Gammaproteobacteria bacterium]